MKKQKFINNLDELKTAIIKISDVIKKTAGANGRTILINNSVDCVSTKDGISVLNAYKPLNDIELTAKLLLQQALSRQLLEHGDGTTATACFFGEFLKQKIGLEEIGLIDNYIEDLKNNILEKSSKSFDIKDVALVSSNFNTEIANIVTKAIADNGINGTYIVEPSSNLGIELKQSNGFEFKSGFFDPIFMNYNGRCEYINPLFLVKRDITINEVAQFSDEAIKNNRPLVIIGDFDEQVKQSVVYNHAQGICRYCLIKLNQFGKEKDDLINDISMVIQHCTKIIVKAKSSIVEHSTELGTYINKINNLEVSSDLEKQQLNERIARLKGQVCKIIVGERTTAGLRSKLDSIDDCVKSCISALKYGVVDGGGYYLLTLAKYYDDDDYMDKNIKKIFENVAFSYYAAILQNAGIEPDGRFHNLNTYTIVDSAGVVASSLCNAWAGAREVLYSDGLIMNF